MNKLFKNVAICLMLSLLADSAFGGQLNREWVKTYKLDPTKTNQAAGISITADRGIVVAGTSVNEFGNQDYFLIKYRPDGLQLWEYRHNSSGIVNDHFVALATDPIGNSFVTGTTETIKVNHMGQYVWSRPYAARAIAANSQFVYVTGFSETDFATAQLENNDLDGQTLWERFWNGRARRIDVSEAIVLSPSGDIFISGTETIHGTDPRVFELGAALIRYNSLGETIWTGTAGSAIASGIHRFRVPRLVVDSLGASFLGSTFFEHQLMKFDNRGTNIWNKGIATDLVPFLALSGSGNPIAAGRNGENDAYVIKFRADGTQDWSYTYANPTNGRDEISAIAVDKDDNIFVAGFTLRTPTDNDLLVIKLSPDGKLLAMDHYDSPQHGTDFGTAIAIDPSGNAYVTGWSSTAEGGSEFVTIKYPSVPKIGKTPSGVIHLEFSTLPHRQYAIESTTNFVNWTSLITNTAERQRHHSIR